MEFDKFYKYLEGRPLAEIVKCQQSIDEIVIQRKIENIGQASLEALNQSQSESEASNDVEKARVKSIMSNIVTSHLLVPSGMNGYNRDSKRFVRWVPGYNRPAPVAIASEQNISQEWFLHKELQLYIHWCSDGYYEMSCKDSLKFNQNYNDHLLDKASPSTDKRAAVKADQLISPPILEKRKSISFSLPEKEKKLKPLSAIAQDWSYFSDTSEGEKEPPEEKMKDVSSKYPSKSTSILDISKPTSSELSRSDLPVQSSAEEGTITTSTTAILPPPPLPTTALSPPFVIPPLTSTVSPGSEHSSQGAAIGVGSTVQVIQGTRRGQLGQVLGTHWASETVFRVQFHGKEENLPKEHLQVTERPPAEVLDEKPRGPPIPIATVPPTAPSTTQSAQSSVESAPVSSLSSLPLPLSVAADSSIAKSEPPPCAFYWQGTCRNGDSCKFSHTVGITPAQRKPDSPTKSTTVTQTQIVLISNRPQQKPDSPQAVAVNTQTHHTSDRAGQQNSPQVSPLHASSEVISPMQETTTIVPPSAPPLLELPIPESQSSSLRAPVPVPVLERPPFVPRSVTLASSNAYVEPAYPTYPADVAPFPYPHPAAPYMQPPLNSFPRYGLQSYPPPMMLPPRQPAGYAPPLFPPHHYFNVPQMRPEPPPPHASVAGGAPPLPPPRATPSNEALCWVRVKAGKYKNEEGEFIGQNSSDTTLARVRFLDRKGLASHIEIKVCDLAVFSLADRNKELSLDLYLTACKIAPPARFVPAGRETESTLASHSTQSQPSAPTFTEHHIARRTSPPQRTLPSTDRVSEQNKSARAREDERVASPRATDRRSHERKRDSRTSPGRDSPTRRREGGDDRSSGSSRHRDTEEIRHSERNRGREEDRARERERERERGRERDNRDRERARTEEADRERRREEGRERKRRSERAEESQRQAERSRERERDWERAESDRQPRRESNSRESSNQNHTPAFLDASQPRTSPPRDQPRTRTPTTNGYLRNVLHSINVPERVRTEGIAERPRDPFPLQMVDPPTPADDAAAQVPTQETRLLSIGDLVNVVRGVHTGLIAVVVNPPVSLRDEQGVLQEYVILLNDGRNTVVRLTSEYFTPADA